MKKNICTVLLLLFLCICLASCGDSFDRGNSSLGYGAMDSELLFSQIDGSIQNNESYNEIIQNAFISTQTEPTKAFSLKVDTAAYTNILRYIKSGNVPPVDAVRTEELLNYFDYDAAVEESPDHPFGVVTQIAASPFSEGKYMAYIRVKTAEIATDNLPPSNLTFLIDTSGSMYSYDKLPLVVKAFSLLTEHLTENDRVSIVVYAGSAGVVLDSARGNDKDAIIAALNALEAGGSTAGQEGIQKAYSLAKKNYIEGGNNRVILATDGDFNVGISNTQELKNFISEKRNDGIYLSCLGFGTGNLRDDMMETLSANGNGNYSYIDSLFTAQKVLIEEMGGNLFTVANDVKSQIRFNQENVSEYRLVGYENRTMSSEEFDDDNKDAGEIGAGTDVIVLVELKLKEGYTGGHLFDVCIRYKDPDNNASHEAVYTNRDITQTPDKDYNFACSVAAFCEKLRGSSYVNTTVEDIIEYANANKGDDIKGYRAGFVDMMAQYLKLDLHTAE